MTGPDPAGQTPVGAPGHRRRPRGDSPPEVPDGRLGGQPSGFFLSGPKQTHLGQPPPYGGSRWLTQASHHRRGARVAHRGQPPPYGGASGSPRPATTVWGASGSPR